MKGTILDRIRNEEPEDASLLLTVARMTAQAKTTQHEERTMMYT